MKKKQVFDGVVIDSYYPNLCKIDVGEEDFVYCKNLVLGQKVRVSITKKRSGKYFCRLVEVLENAEIEKYGECEVSGRCGGCLYEKTSVDWQEALKEKQIRELFEEGLGIDFDEVYDEFISNPSPKRYRNKMEYSFGNELIDAPITLGMHKRASMHDIVPASNCVLVHEDFNKILNVTIDYFNCRNCSFYHKKRHEGFLRYLIIRLGANTGELMINLVTSSKEETSVYEYVKTLVALEEKLDNRLVSIYHTVNDGLGDKAEGESLILMHGRSYIEERLGELSFKIKPFSFFQPNSHCALKLYQKVRDYLGDKKYDTLYDLYCGTGTMSQMMADKASKVIGVDIVPSSIEGAIQASRQNGVTNCEFIVGDVFETIKAINDMGENAVAIVDPPRAGMMEKATRKLMEFGLKNIVYVSCNPKTLIADLKILISEYSIEKVSIADQFTNTAHAECVVLLSRKK